MATREPEEFAPSRVIPVALLVMGVAIGLLGAAGRLVWNGPLAARAVAVGGALEGVLVVLLVATFRLGKPRTDQAVLIRTWLRYLLAGLIITGAVLLLVRANLHLPPADRHFRPPQPPPAAHQLKKSSGGALPNWVLYVLIAICVLGAIAAALSLSLRLRNRPTVRIPPRGGEAVDPEDLRDALAEGAAALRDIQVDDARKAIIACYVAMEKRLANTGAARSDADTPDELLARATEAGLVHGTAARTLTGLFYEARFSTHPLGAGKRDTARRALDEMMTEVRA
jgi:hypothetical protein